MKYTLIVMLALAIFGGIPAVVQQEGRTHILAETISAAWRRSEIENRAVQGARILRDIYKTTAEQGLSFDAVVASRDGYICYFMKTWDARKSEDLAYALFESDATRVRFGLEFKDVNGRCDGPWSRDLSAFVEKAFGRRNHEYSRSPQARRKETRSASKTY